MASKRAAVRHDRPRRTRELLLLGSVSLVAIVASGVVAESRSLQTPASALTPTAAVMAAQQAAAAQATAAAQQAQASMTQAAAALRAALAAQAAASAAAQNAASSIPNGLAVNGLNPADGAGDPTTGTKFALNPTSKPIDPTLWQNALAPVRSVDPTTGRVTVDIVQTGPKAILNWQTFNVGRNTTVDFIQGASNWAVLNRIADPNMQPSQILGQVKATGSVYVINPNGIIFGAGSQINVGSLIATDLDVGALGANRTARDNLFLNTGIGAAPQSFSTTLAVTGAHVVANTFQGGAVGGGVEVDAGATITTNVNPTSPGFVYLIGANVSNQGTIVSPAGEVAMVSAQEIKLTSGSYGAASLPSNVLTSAGFRETGFTIQQQYTSLYNVQAAGPVGIGSFRPGTGAITNEGVIETPQGAAVMIGDRITIDSLRDAGGNIVRDASGNLVTGVVYAPTSISRNSMVLLDAATSVNMNGVISVPPLENGETLGSGAGASSGSTVQNFTPAFVEMSGQLNVALGPGALVSAPSASVSLNAIANNPAFAGAALAITPSLTGAQGIVLAGPGTVAGVAAAGAVIDVAGLQDVQLPASYNFIAIQPRGIDFADEPLQRNGPLFGQTLYIDIRATGKRANGSTWCGTPVANVCGFVANVPQSIDQLMTAGGTVSFKTDINTTAATSVTLQPGSVVNTAGGFQQFLPGTVPTTFLLGTDGHLYNIANASPDITYVGVAGQNTITQPHWSITQTSTSLTQTTEAGYLQGSAAGGVSITTVNPALQGTLLFGSISGERQVAAGTAPSQGTLSITTPSSVVIGAPASVSANFTSTSQFTTTLSAGQLSSYGLSGLSITANDVYLAAGNTLTLAPGGSFSVTVPGAIDIAGTVAAAGGKISLVTDLQGFAASSNFAGRLSVPTTLTGKSDVYVEGTLDVSGRWVNDFGQTGAGAFGPGFINGGSIAIATNSSSANGGGPDTTGNIILAAGSLLDASSGGYISPQGAARTVSAGVMAGSAGSISLGLYQGLNFADPQTPGGHPVFPTSGTVAALKLDGTLRAYGFQANGTLTLDAPQTIQIGGQPAANGQPAGGGMYLSTSAGSLLANGGFGTYVIDSTPDGYTGISESITVAAGTSLVLRQQNLSSFVDYITVPTGTKIAAVAPLATLPSDQRAPVNLTLASNTITLGAGAVIATDPHANVAFFGTPVGPGASFGFNFTGSNTAQSVLLLGSIIDHGGAVSIFSSETWLGPNATIDLSGTVIHNSLFGVGGNFRGVSDTLLPGGTFTVEAFPLTGMTATSNATLTGSYLVAQAGATVDVSGVSATIQAGTGPRSLTNVAMWSDAGTVSADVGAFVWGGNFVAAGGRSPVTGQANPLANGGTLILGGSNIVLQQSSSNVVGALASVTTPTSASDLVANGQIGLPSSLGAFTDQIFAGVDRLGAFSNVFLYSAATSGGAGHIFTDLVDKTFGFNPASFVGSNVTISGPLTWSVANRLEIAAGTITLDGNTPSASAVLSAPYVLFTGGSGTAVSATNAASRLAVDAMNIDVEGAVFSNFAKVTLGGAPGAGSPNVYTTADIRLSTPKVSNGVNVNTSGGAIPVNPSTFSGSMSSGGDLSLFAERIYPVTAVNFTIQSPGTVTFSAPAGSTPVTPLSAGGSLTVNAPVIVQDGNLFAPLGTITLGGANTQQVTLGAGSVTSVSLGGAVVPFGTTQDGTNWFYNNAQAPLAQLPGKALVLNGSNVSVAARSTIDLRGGGDVQASEFVAGTGGSTDTLASTNGGPTVYALLPSRNDAIAAFDIGFTAAQSATQGGDPYPLAGTQITIAGGNGIPGGTYTLYPGHYATLPGALRVVDFGSNVGRNVASGTTLTDGTVLVTGNFTQSTAPGTHSSGSELFAVQTGAVWQQYSQYTFSSGNSYNFAAQNHKAGPNTPPPPLPIDAGRLAVVAQQQMLLAGTALTQPGVDSTGRVGRSGELDLSGGQLAVVNGTGNAPANYVAVDVNQLNGLNFGSILIGGLRSDQANGSTLITPTASSVIVDTNGVALTAPEVLLVAAATPQTQTVNQTVSIAGGNFTTNFQVSTTVAGTGSVTIKSGSVIDTSGGVQSSFSRNYVYAGAGANNVTAQSIATALGGTLDSTGTVINGANILNFFTSAGTPINKLLPLFGGGMGAMFVATNDPNVTVTGPAGTAAPALTVNFANFVASPTVSFPVTGSVTLPSGGSGNVTIEAGTRISTGTLSLQATAPSNAVVFNKPVSGAPAAVIQAKQVNLTAQSIGLGTGATGALALSADTLAGQLGSIQGLALKAYNGNITFANGVSIGGALQRLTLDAPALVGTGANADINASGGTVTIVNSGAAAAAPTAVGGGALSIAAAEIDLGGGVQTIAGFSEVDLTATSRIFLTGSGALTLGSSGATPVNLAMTTPNILVGGATASGTGSQFTLTTLGNVTIARPAGSQADPGISSQIGGNFALKAASIDDAGTIQAQAGTLSLQATTGNLTLDDGARIAAGGFAKTLNDVTTFVYGGTVSLQADLGNVVTTPTSVIDVSQLAGSQGYGGTVNVTATVGAANVQGQILASGFAGNAARGIASRGGSFNLMAGGAVALDPLADLLFAGGVTGSINIRSLSGNLQLSAGHTLRANSITLTADDTTSNGTNLFGQVIVGGVIQSGCTVTFCTGEAGGQVALYGTNAVVLQSTAQIVASTTHADKLGGNVTLGLGWNATGNIDLQSGSTIDVSGGSAGGLNGGTVYLRAPLVTGTAFQQGSVRILGLNSSISGARAFTVEDYITVSTESDIGLPNLSWNGVIDPAKNPAFTNAIAQFVQGTLTGNGVSYGFSGAIAMLTQPSIATMLQNSKGAQINLLPGVELVNASTVTNNGNITIASNWNLAAGTALNLQQIGGNSFYNPSTSAVNFQYRYVANFGTQAQPQFQIEPGVLTLVAAGNININASISDGFFSFGNYTNPGYVTAVKNYLINAGNQLGSTGFRGIDPSSSQNSNFLFYLNSYAAAPVAPYDAAAAQANSANPTSSELAGADLFPHLLNVCANCNGTDPAHPPTIPTSQQQIVQVTNPGSWTYDFTGGAAVRFTNGAVAISANPSAMLPLAAVQSGPFAGGGNVVVSGNSTYQQPLFQNGNATVTLPTMVRTGTGNITISAAQDITLTDPSAPGVIYAAGVNTAPPASPGYHLDASGNVVASNPSGFLTPQVLAYDSIANSNDVSQGFTAVFGPPTAAAFPSQGGSVTLVAQRDIVRNGNPTTTTSVFGQKQTFANYQYFFPWLLADAGVTPVDNTTDAPQATTMGAGVFAPFGNQIASQSAWWIQYGSFQQGILSAGGNVSVTAGRDLIDVSVSLPTTGYVSGGLASIGSGVISTPVTTVIASGDMTVRAGRNILGGAFYEGSGNATIVAGGSVGANGNLTVRNGTLPDLPVLAVDSGRISLTAGGSVAIGGVVNPAELHAQAGSFADPVKVAGGNANKLLMDTYGPNSSASVVSIAGDVNIANSQTSTIYAQFSSATTVYPASFSAIALNGSITTNGLNAQNNTNNPGITLAGSPNGAFQLLAENNIDLTGGLSASSNPRLFPTFSTGPSLLDLAFDPYQPNNGADAAFSTAVLAQATNASTAKIYAVTGNITGAGQISINRPATILAGQDIADLNLAVENIAASDVSTVTAGRDIYYTGSHNLGGIQVAGPGFFVAQAGRNLGPFLPANVDTPALAQVQEGIVSVGNAGVSVIVNPTLLVFNPSNLPVTSTLPVGNQWVVNGSPGMYNPALLGPFANAIKNRNAHLSTTGADVIASFGVANKVNYQAVIDTYIDPANAANVAHNYVGELTTFLCTTGALSCAQGTPSASAAFAAFTNLPAEGKQALQQVFVDQVLTAEIKSAGNTSSPLATFYKTIYDAKFGPQETVYKSALLLDAYIMINTMFPASNGYTNNLSGPLQTVGTALAAALGGSSTGRSAVNVSALVQSVDLTGPAGDFKNQHPALVQTGDLNLLHATIQTDLGGNISILGPGGGVNVGSLAVEPNARLKLNNLGILTLSGGAINTVTDASVLVGSSRVFTEQGGDISMWSSNVNLDAGRGAKTTSSQPPLQVFFDVDDNQTVNPVGLVTGAGIGVLQTTNNSTTSNLLLQAPRGIVDFGTAGVRSSGNLVVVAPVVNNASNAGVGGTTTGVPTVTAPNVGALSAASSTAGAAAKTAETPTGSTTPASQPSVFVVEVLGYGGGEGPDGNNKKPPGDNQGSPN